MGKVSDPYRIIRAPLLSEKCHELKERHNQGAFRVDPAATKSDIKAAVERIFKAKVAAVNVVSYAAGGVKSTWLALTVALVYMVGGYLVTGRTAPDQLFLAVVYALLLVAPLAHVDGAVLHRLFGNPMARQLRIVGEPGPRSLFPEWL